MANKSLLFFLTVVLMAKTRTDKILHRCKGLSSTQSHLQRSDCIRKVSSTLREAEGQGFLSDNFVMDRKHCFIVSVAHSVFTVLLLFKKRKEK